MRSSVNAYLPDEVSLPGETLQEVLDDRQMSQANLAERTGRPKKTINEIIKGKAAITPETALQLERVLGVSASFWNNLERNYQEYLARKGEEDLFEASAQWLKELPVKELEKRGWIEKQPRTADQVRAVLQYFGVASPNQWRQVFELPQVSFRHSPSFKSSPGALAAWLRRGEIEAQLMKCDLFDASRFRASLLAAKALTTQDPEVFVPQLQAICAAAGVAVVFVPELPNCRVCGATRWLSPHKALIQLSLRYRTNDHLWFTFFHEAGHVLLHGKKLTFIEGGSEAPSDEEEEANRFSADQLIPPHRLAELKEATQARRLSEAMVLRFAESLGIAPGIVVGRLQHDGWLPQFHLNGLKISYTWG